MLGKLIKLQGVISKITVPEVHNPKDCEIGNASEFVPPESALE